MAFDIAKLSPAPWQRDDEGPGIHSVAGGCVCHIQCHGNVNTIRREREEFSHADAEFIALARNAFDVMVRRGWSPFRCSAMRKNDWEVINDNGSPIDMDQGDGWPDPFTALVEADKWYRLNVDKENP